MKRLLLHSIVLLLGGCTLIPAPKGDRTYFLLPAQSCGEVSGEAKHGKLRLALSNGTSNQLLLSQKILFSSDPLTRGAYQYALWTEPPGRRVPALLHQALECRPEVVSVTRDGAPSEGNVSVSVVLSEFYHDTSTTPGAARIELRVELTAPDHTLLGSRTFSKTVPAASFDARGAVEAFGKGVDGLAGEVSAWIVENSSR